VRKIGRRTKNLSGRVMLISGRIENTARFKR
jgi:hypothetical protein